MKCIPSETELQPKLQSNQVIERIIDIYVNDAFNKRWLKIGINLALEKLDNHYRYPILGQLQEYILSKHPESKITLAEVVAIHHCFIQKLHDYISPYEDLTPEELDSRTVEALYEEFMKNYNRVNSVA